LWAVAIEQLAHIGYDPNNMALVAYDWRLSLPALETRDGYYTKLQKAIETLYHTNGGRRVVVAVHSMGGVVWHYFASRQEHLERGWVEKHIHAVAHVGTPHLGVPKAISATLSGEMKDTAELGDWIDRIRKIMLGNVDMVGLFRSFHSVMNMAPRGGARVWGTTTFAADEQDGYWEPVVEPHDDNLDDFNGSSSSAGPATHTPAAASSITTENNGRCGAYLRDMWHREGMMSELFGKYVEESAVCSADLSGDPLHMPAHCHAAHADEAAAARVEAQRNATAHGSLYQLKQMLVPMFHPMVARTSAWVSRQREAMIMSQYAPWVVVADHMADRAVATYFQCTATADAAYGAAQSLWREVRRIAWEMLRCDWAMLEGLRQRLENLFGNTLGVVFHVGETVVGDKEHGLVKLAGDLERQIERLGIFTKIHNLKTKLAPIRTKINQVSRSLAASLPDTPMLLSSVLQELEEVQFEDLRPSFEFDDVKRNWWLAVTAATESLNELKRSLHGTTR